MKKKCLLIAYFLILSKSQAFEVTGFVKLKITDLKCEYNQIREPIFSIKSHVGTTYGLTREYQSFTNEYPGASTSICYDLTFFQDNLLKNQNLVTVWLQTYHTYFTQLNSTRDKCQKFLNESVSIVLYDSYKDDPLKKSLSFYSRNNYYFEDVALTECKTFEPNDL